MDSIQHKVNGRGWFRNGSIFPFPVKIDKIDRYRDLKIGAVLVLTASDRPASRAVNKDTGAEMVRVARCF